MTDSTMEYVDPRTRKHEWTSDQETILVTILEELVAKGVKCDGGNFKGGTYETIAKAMNERSPGCSVIAKNVANKIKRMKEKYHAATEMVNQSGFGWSEIRQCVEVDSKQVLDAYMKSHPNAPHLIGKSYPLYPRLLHIFGKDRANGKAAESLADAVENIEAEQENIDQNEEVVATDSPQNTNAPTSSAKVQSRKRARETSHVNEFIDAFNVGIEGTRKDFMVIAEKIGNGTGSINDDMAQELMKLGLTRQEVIRAGIRLMQNPGYVSFFRGMDREMKLDFIKTLLS